MATQQRIDDLKHFCQQWQERLECLVKHREQLRNWQHNAFQIDDSDGKSLLPTLIEDTDKDVQRNIDILAKMEWLRDRAVAGEDV
jgi:hypothetical protein